MPRVHGRAQAADRAGASHLLHAFVLGLAQGPTELLPVSSSAHAALLPGLLGWDEADLGMEARNGLEVALHAGTAAALSALLRAPGARAAVGRELRELTPRRLVAWVLALVPPALVGSVLERRLERRPGTPGTIAVGLVAGAGAMVLADSAGGRRTLAEAGPADGLALGVAQALALLPGVSRNGATLTAARLRGFTREDAQALSWRAGLPVLLGAAALKAVRRKPARPGARHGLRGGVRGCAGPAGDDARRGCSPDGVSDHVRGRRAAHAAATAGAFLSTLAAAPLLHRSRRARPLAPFALYRCVLALLAVRRSGSLRRQSTGGLRTPAGCAK